MYKIGGRYKRCSRTTVGVNGVPAAFRFEPLPSRFKVVLNKTGMPQAYRDSEYNVWVDDMANFFEQIIIGVASLPTQNIVLDIDILFKQLEPNILGQCGPGDGTWWNIPAYLGDLRFDSGTQTATVRHATMAFSHDYYKVNPTNETDRSWKRQFFTTALHECFHAVGFGSLWNGPFRIISYILSNPILLSTVFPYNVVGTGNPTNPQYTRTKALAEYRNEMVGQSAVVSIPIENYQMAANTIMINAGGTALAHWKGSINGTLSGIVDRKGRDFINEVMTAWSSRNEGVNRWIGRCTLAALEDIGWSIDYLPLEVSLNEYRTI